MKVVNGTPLALGWVVGKIAPPKWAATFFLKGTFTLRPGGIAAYAAEPRLLSGDLYADDNPAKALLYPTDFAPFKPRADVLVHGTAYAPGGKPTPTFPVSIRVGGLSKRLSVFGERRWKRGPSGLAGATDPAPVASVALTHESAYGGPGYSRNPLGRGFGSNAAPLVDDPARPARGPADDAEPAGFGPLPAQWLQRAASRGTYDDDWLNARWPWFPRDFDWAYFNAAPRDQQLDGYLRGDEDLEFRSLHPDIPIYRSRLPHLRPRCFVADRVGRHERFREVTLKLDTLWADPVAGVLVLVWRGHQEVQTLKLNEVDRIVVAVEQLAEAPHPPDHYLDVTVADDEPEIESPDSDAAEQRAALELTFSAMEQQMAAMDSDFAALESELAAMRAEGEAELEKYRKDLVARGANPALFERQPPEASAVELLDETVAKMRETDPAAAANAELHRNWIANAERELAAMDGEMARMDQEIDAFRASMELGAPPRRTREAIRESAAAGQSLAGADLAEVDLSQLSLAGMNFRGALLGKSNLSGANLSGADLREADLSRADLTGAVLDQARLDGADLTGASLAGATFSGVSLASATLAGLDLKGVDLTGCNAERADFAGTNLAGAIFDRAKLLQADFTGANLTGARFAHAALRAAQFERVQAKGINCEGADLTGLHGSGGSDFSRGNFRRARAAGAIFAEATLHGADFSSALLADAQFSDASLPGAVFDSADLQGALFDDARLQGVSLVKANLLRAGFDRADLSDARCRGANFYEAGFWDATTHSADFRDAYLAGTLLAGRRESKR